MSCCIWATASAFFSTASSHSDHMPQVIAKLAMITMYGNITFKSIFIIAPLLTFHLKDYLMLCLFLSLDFVP